MHINSGIIGMESERRFISSKRQNVRFTRTTVNTTLSGLKNSLDLGEPIAQGEESGKEEQGDTKKTPATGTDFQNAMTDLNNRFSIRKTDRLDYQEQFRQLRTIRELCLEYILELFEKNPKGIRNNGLTASGTTFSDFVNKKQSDFQQQIFTVDTLYCDISSYYEEVETTDYTVQGMVNTADGRTISFNLDLYMTRSFTEAFGYHDRQTISQNVMLCDPLVINLDGNIPELSDQKFLFDIDSDGVMDNISRLGKNSGYLALDINNDGIINDGSELFGTESGDGFFDLAKYDSDNNGWIDEGDDIWDKLLIWSSDEKGNDILYHLSEKGIGAICLKNAETQFSLNSMTDNSTNGLIRKTGIFLYENGNVGTIQHLDLVSRFNHNL